MCFVAHKGAYLQGFLHRDISPNNILITENPAYEGGMLIDWDLCQTSFGAEEPGAPHRKSRTVRGVFPSDANTLRINVTPASQGTWDYIAADLLDDPGHQHSFVHDLESFFYVLLYLGLVHLRTDWDQGRQSCFMNTVIDRRRFGDSGKGGFGKLLFMVGSVRALNGLTFTSNEPLTKLVTRLKQVLSVRYIDGSGSMLSFVSKDVYDALEYRHDNIIKLFDQALESDGWPENDRAPLPVTLPSISSIGILRANSKRAFNHVSTGGTTGGTSTSNSSVSVKRAKSGQ
jgi:hypothetical protein